MNHRVLAKLIPIFMEFQQFILKTAGNCENYGTINNFGHNLGQYPELEDKRVWYGTVMIQLTFNSPKFSPFEKMST